MEDITTLVLLYLYYDSNRVSRNRASLAIKRITDVRSRGKVAAICQDLCRAHLGVDSTGADNKNVAIKPYGTIQCSSDEKV